MSERWEERAVTISTGSDAAGDLEGVFIHGRDADATGAVIAPPHPLFGGSMDSPVVSELAHACARTGIASLRFNWRGVGASAGRATDDASAADADYAAALAHQADTVPGKLLACGYSFGAASAVRVAPGQPRVRGLLLVAPPPRLLDAVRLGAFRGRVLVVVGEADEWAPPAELEALLEGAARACLHVIPDADHFFLSGLAELSRVAREWLAEA